MKSQSQLLNILTVLVMLVASVLPMSARDDEARYDVAIIGGGASGVAAAVEASRLGATVLLVESGEWLGGMLTSAGVCAIDGNYNLKAGFWGEFYRALEGHYGSAQALKTGWVSNVLFEPHVGNELMYNFVNREKNVTLTVGTSLVSVKKKRGAWVCTLAKDGVEFTAKAEVLIDATELGDVAALLGVPYDIGMESRSVTGEDIAPAEANGIIQDLTYVAVLKDYGTPQQAVRPEGYDPAPYLCCCINERCESPSEPDRMWSPEMMLGYGRLPGNKFMINWPIEGNDYYLNVIEMTADEREAALQKAKNFTLGFVYFMQTELGMNTLGLADDEFPTADRLPLIPYHRESRRIHGKVRFTLPHISTPYACEQPLYRTAIAVGDYPVDHHHARYQGAEELPRLYFHPVPSFGLPLGAMIPEKLDNFIVAEKSISVSNIVNGATRLQPVVLQIGTAAGALAALASTRDVKVCKVEVRDVQRAVLEAGGYLLPYLDVPQDDAHFAAYQRIGATGILQGEGRNEGWTNQTWLRVADTVYFDEVQGLKALYSLPKLRTDHAAITAADLVTLARAINNNVGVADFELAMSAAFQAAQIEQRRESKLTRGQFAVFIDSLFKPFDTHSVTIEGVYKQQTKN